MERKGAGTPGGHGAMMMTHATTRHLIQLPQTEGILKHVKFRIERGPAAADNTVHREESQVVPLCAQSKAADVDKIARRTGRTDK